MPLPEFADTAPTMPALAGDAVAPSQLA
jgi:hypothetical protein